MSALSQLPYKGTRDYYPEDKRVQNYIFSTWRRVVERYGYQEYGAPLLEPLEVYTAKSGQELANEQTYSFVDRGDRKVAIRPEMTPSISRMVAARRQELGYPARLYSIANFMRYERPQRGREREFWQLNADIFGVENVLADAEVIGLAHEIMAAFGALDDMYVIRVNNRGFINDCMSTYLGLDADGAQRMMNLLDRKDKISEGEFGEQAEDIIKSEQNLGKLQQLLDAKTIEQLPAELQETAHVSELRDLFERLSADGVANARFDFALMRGLDYYTGMVFEVFDLHPDNNRAMFGGGRYDGLVGLFGAEPVPTVGFAPGLTTTELFLRSHGLLPALLSTTEIGIVVMDDSLPAALLLARELREAGVNAEIDISGRKIDKQIKAVLKKDIPFIVFVDRTDAKEGIYDLKDSVSGEVERLNSAKIIAKVKEYRLYSL